VIVLDTHAWLWWRASPDRLSAAARDALERAEKIGVCTISCWEVAMLVARGRISLDRDVGLWVRQALTHERVATLELSAEAALAAGRLDAARFGGDPADRLIYATAATRGVRLVTKDERIRSFDRAGTVW